MEASAHRSNARDALRGNWPTAALVAFLAGLISGDSNMPSININFESSEPVQVTTSEALQQFLGEWLGLAMPMILAVTLTILVVRLILGGAAQVGKARYNLHLIDRQEAQTGDLFSGFSQFVPAMVMSLLSTLLILGGMLLLIVPGIILSLSFAMAPYILAEDPECTGWEALKRSRRMMQGHKAELFWLDLTFFGWEILANLTFGIGHLFLNPYRAAANASFYRDVQRLENVGVEEF